MCYCWPALCEVASLGKYCVSWDTAAPQFSNGLKKTRLFPGYRQRVALYSAYRQRVGDVSSEAAAKISVSARHAERAWLEPCQC